MIRALMSEELDVVCERITAMDPWKCLRIEGEAMADAIRNDSLRQYMAWTENGEIQGVVMFRVRHYADILFFRNGGEQLAVHHQMSWPCDWKDVPDGGYVSTLAVFEGHRGKGLGCKLLDYAEEQIKQGGGVRAYLTVSDFNASAQQLYIRQGYTRIGSIQNSIRPGNLEHIMEKVFSGE